MSSYGLVLFYKRCFTRLLYFTVAPPARKNHSNHFPDKMYESEGHNTRHPNGTGQFPVISKSPDSPHNTSDNCRAPPQYKYRSPCRPPGNQCQTFQGMWQSDRIRHLPRGSEGPTEYTCTAEDSGYESGLCGIRLSALFEQISRIIIGNKFHIQRPALQISAVPDQLSHRIHVFI